MGELKPCPHGSEADYCDSCRIDWEKRATAIEPRIQAFWDNQGTWSQSVFGTDSERGPVGPLKHLEKEAREAQDSPFDLEEKADCLFLIFDAVRRSGKTLPDLMDACEKKLEINKARKWNKNVKEGEPIEHIREKSAIETAAEEMAKAISRHRYDIWGDGGEVCHDADRELYAALLHYEQAKEGKQ